MSSEVWYLRDPGSDYPNIRASTFAGPARRDAVQRRCVQLYDGADVLLLSFPQAQGLAEWLARGMPEPAEGSWCSDCPDEDVWAARARANTRAAEFDSAENADRATTFEGRWVPESNDIRLVVPFPKGLLGDIDQPYPPPPAPPGSDLLGI